MADRAADPRPGHPGGPRPQGPRPHPDLAGWPHGRAYAARAEPRRQLRPELDEPPRLHEPACARDRRGLRVDQARPGRRRRSGGQDRGDLFRHRRRAVPSRHRRRRDPPRARDHAPAVRRHPDRRALVARLARRARRHGPGRAPPGRRAVALRRRAAAAHRRAQRPGPRARARRARARHRPPRGRPTDPGRLRRRGRRLLRRRRAHRLNSRGAGVRASGRRHRPGGHARARRGRRDRPAGAAALAGAILRLAGDPTLAQAIARAGRKRVDAQFSLGAKLDATEALYRRLVAA